MTKPSLEELPLFARLLGVLLGQLYIKLIEFEYLMIVTGCGIKVSPSDLTHGNGRSDKYKASITS